uniref:Immunoglobulin I-set domain protein n=1 Tax=Heterorhabditis bacteriophora TaxID=37862 RepID=A0A1I7XHF4_HETBA
MKAENDAGEVSCTANMATYTSEMFSESESEAQAEEIIGDDMTVTDEESFREELHRTPTPIMAPKFITKIKDTRTKKGHEAIFECVVPDTKGVCCKWYVKREEMHTICRIYHTSLKDGKEIELIARIRVQTRTIEGHITQELIIENVTPEDAGKYTVIVENRAGKDMCEANLIVVESIDKIPERAPEFVIKLQDKSMKISDKLVFECKVMGEPEPKIKWFHESKLLEEEYKKIIIENVEGVQRLVIDSVDIKHEGNYCCIAENNAGTSKTEAKLTVEAQAPTFTKPLEDKSVFIGEQLILSCSVEGTPQPHVEFFLDSTKLTSSDRVSVEHDATNTHWRIVISDVHKDEIANYSAIASNSAGSTTSKAKVSMKDVSPVFEQGLVPISVRENEEIRMNVKITGTHPEISWFKDDMHIQEDTNHEIISDTLNSAYTLTIKQASVQDAGKYSVKAVNQAGSASSSADTLVIEATEKPTFIKELISTEVKVKQSVTMTVAVKGVPEPEVEWMKDGKKIDIDGKKIIKEKSDITHSITISSAEFEDAGVYSCQATNSAGMANTIANLVVPPIFIQELRPTEVKEAETLQLSVTVTGTPEPKIQWCKDDVPIEIDNMHIFSRDEGNGQFTLTIKDARLTDIGCYSCKASNKGGEAKTEANMGIIENLIPPHFVEQLEPLEVKIGNAAKLSCTVEGKPQPEVKWFKNGEQVYMDDAHIIKKDEMGNHTLIIENVKNTDLGSYTCQAINSIGKDETRAEVNTPKYGFEKAKSEDIEPLFIEPLHEIFAKDGDTVILECRVNKEAKPEIKWFKNDQALVIKSHMITESLDDGRIKLIINNAMVEDFGTYRCEAVNKVGKARTEAPLNIQYAVCAEEAVKDESEQLKEGVDEFRGTFRVVIIRFSLYE